MNNDYWQLNCDAGMCERFRRAVLRPAAAQPARGAEKCVA